MTDVFVGQIYICKLHPTTLIGNSKIMVSRNHKAKGDLGHQMTSASERESCIFILKYLDMYIREIPNLFGILGQHKLAMLMNTFL